MDSFMDAPDQVSQKDEVLMMPCFETEAKLEPAYIIFHVEAMLIVTPE